VNTLPKICTYVYAPLSSVALQTFVGTQLASNSRCGAVIARAVQNPFPDIFSVYISACLVLVVSVFNLQR
jgi:hypothetical protein